MGIQYRKRVRTGRNSWMNVSKRGVSFSARSGPFTFNSRGRTSVRLGKGLTYRGGCMLLVMASIATVATSLVLLRT